MPNVTVLAVDSERELTPQTGEHVWLSIQFTSGVMLNVRVDEHEDTELGRYDSVFTLKKGRNSGWVKETEVKL